MVLISRLNDLNVYIVFQEDNLYQDAVFNQTVTVRENDTGMDAET